jgi:hypothetical protein
MLNLSKILVVVAAPFAIVACCTGVENPDDQLQIEVTDEPAADAALGEDAEAPLAQNVCGADVVAIDEEGNAIALEERVQQDSTGADRCVYVGTVDPAAVYRIEVQREGKLAIADGMVSNPACSIATDPADDDGALTLVEPAPVARLAITPEPSAKRDL